MITEISLSAFTTCLSPNIICFEKEIMIMIIIIIIIIINNI